jgi:large subunit ribosomal protein L32
MAKHPVPKKKTSRGRGNRRYKNFQNRARKRLDQAIQLVVCSNCSSKTRQHHVCPTCGFYRGEDILGKAPKAEAKVTTIKAD